MAMIVLVPPWYGCSEPFLLRKYLNACDDQGDDKVCSLGSALQLAPSTVHRCAECARDATGDKNGDSNLAGLKSDIAGFAARASDTAIADT